MDIPLFDQVADLVRAMTPAELGQLQIKSHRRGLKAWMGPTKPPREHYEAQLLARHHVDGVDGMAIEIGFHAENSDKTLNEKAIAQVLKTEKKWRKVLGKEAEVGIFFGASNWTRISEAWLEPDLEDPELVFEIATRLVDYLTAIEPVRS